MKHIVWPGLCVYMYTPFLLLGSSIHVVTVEHSQNTRLLSTCIFTYLELLTFYNMFMVLGLWLRDQFESLLVFPVTFMGLKSSKPSTLTLV